MEATGSYEGWAIVEILGHQTFAGQVRPEPLFGTEMLRIDVPEIAERSATERRYGPGGYGAYEVRYPAIPGFTKFFGGASLYCLTPCTEEVARAAVIKLAKKPISAVYLPELEPEEKVLQKLLPSGVEDERPRLGMEEDDHPLAGMEERPVCACPHCICVETVAIEGDTCDDCRGGCHNG
jgi:hypothetical protein